MTDYEAGFRAAQLAAARIAAPYHTCKALPGSQDAFEGDGCPRFCEACMDRRRIRDAILKLKPNAETPRHP